MNGAGRTSVHLNSRPSFRLPSLINLHSHNVLRLEEDTLSYQVEFHRAKLRLNFFPSNHFSFCLLLLRPTMCPPRTQILPCLLRLLGQPSQALRAEAALVLGRLVDDEPELQHRACEGDTVERLKRLFMAAASPTGSHSGRPPVPGQGTAESERGTGDAAARLGVAATAATSASPSTLRPVDAPVAKARQVSVAVFFGSRA